MGSRRCKESSLSNGGGCDHVGGPELIEMSESYLRERDVPEDRWSGSCFGYGEEVDSPYWKSVYLEVERRGAGWVVTKIDRLNESLEEAQKGFVVITLE